MKSKNTLYTTSSKTINQNESWIHDVQQRLQKIKRPFLNRVEFSKLRIQNKIQNFKNEKQAWNKYQGILQCLIQKLSDNQHYFAKQQKELTEQSQSHSQINLPKENNFKFQEDSDSEKENEIQAKSHLAQWQGRDKQRMFKNSSNMMDQFDRVFNKKIGINQVSQSKKIASYSYRKEQKEMLEKIFVELKNQSQNSVEFQKIYEFFNDCKLFYTVYGISPGELQDIVSCSAHKYSNKLTKEEFFDLFLVNSESRSFDQLENKVQKICCLQQQNWTQLKQLFNQLDTFGYGTVNTREFFHKMKTVSVSKQLLQAKTIYFTSVNRYYSFSKVIFELQNKRRLPEKLTWTELQSQIVNFSHVDQPSMNEIFEKQIKYALIQKDTNSFLLKENTLALLKEEFNRCPKFSEHFVKCKYFCEELLSMENIHGKMSEVVRQNRNGKGFVSLHANIRLLQIQGPQYFDMDEMLTYFSVKGFQLQAGLNNLKDSFDTNSTASDEEFQERKRQERRTKRMKSLDHMKKIMDNAGQFKFDKQNKKIPLKPVKVQEFNLTKPRDHLTIRQQKVKQMIEEKQRKERQQQRPFVPANPIPASINCQRYMQQRSKQQTRRQLQKIRRQKVYEQNQKNLAYLQSNTKLFEKRDPLLLEEQKRKFLSPQPKTEFEAKPISWFVKERNLLEVIQGEKQQRRKNRLKQTSEKYVYGYWKEMPYQGDSNFKKQAMTQNLDQAKSDDSLALQVKQMKDILDIEKQQKPITTIVPDFAKLQKEFMEKLQSKKKMRSPTVVKQFNLSVSKKKQPQMVLEKTIKRPQTPKKSNNHTQKQESTPIIVGTTKKYESMVEMTQQKIAQKNYEAELKLMQEKQRKKKQKIFAKYMCKALQQENSKLCPQSSQRTTRKNNCQRSSRVDQQNQLRKIYEKVLSRPFLFQTACSQSEGLKKGGKSCKNSERKHKKQVPKKVKIPSEQVRLEIPPLQYIEQEQYPVDYENERKYFDQEGEYIVREFQDHSQVEDQSYAEDVYPGEENDARDTLVQHLNQSF